MRPNLAINDDGTVMLDQPSRLTLTRMAFITADDNDGNAAITAAVSGQAPTGGSAIDTFFGYTVFRDAFRDSCAGLNGDPIASFGGGSALDVRSRPRLQDMLLPGCFLAVLAVVLLWTDWSGRGNWVAELENRKPAPRPELPRSLGDVTAYPERFGAFFADRFGFRREMLNLRGRIALRLLHKSSSPLVIVGSHGWLFYAGEQSIPNHLHQISVPAAELDNWARQLQERRLWFAAHGIKYLFVIAPDKQSIYSEYMPRYLAPQQGETRLDQLSRRLFREPAWLDLRAPLRSAKDNEPLYFQLDTHWNDRGAHYAYRAIMQRLGLPALDRPENALAEYERAGDLARMSGIIEKENDAAFPTQCAIAERVAYDVALPPGPNQPSPTDPYDAPASRCSTGTERLLMFHDSFGEALWPYLSESFARVVYVWRQPSLEQMQAVVAVDHPTVVIEERVERFLINPLRS